MRRVRDIHCKYCGTVWEYDGEHNNCPNCGAVATQEQIDEAIQRPKNKAALFFMATFKSLTPVFAIIAIVLFLLPSPSKKYAKTVKAEEQYIDVLPTVDYEVGDTIRLTYYDAQFRIDEAFIITNPEITKDVPDEFDLLAVKLSFSIKDLEPQQLYTEYTQYYGYLVVEDKLWCVPPIDSNTVKRYYTVEPTANLTFGEFDWVHNGSNEGYLHYLIPKGTKQCMICFEDAGYLKKARHVYQVFRTVINL